MVRPCCLRIGKAPRPLKVALFFSLAGSDAAAAPPARGSAARSSRPRLLLKLAMGSNYLRPEALSDARAREEKGSLRICARQDAANAANEEQGRCYLQTRSEMWSEAALPQVHAAVMGLISADTGDTKRSWEMRGRPSAKLHVKVLLRYCQRR
jgi:hypothetical protein